MVKNSSFSRKFRVHYNHAVKNSSKLKLGLKFSQKLSFSSKNVTFWAKKGQFSPKFSAPSAPKMRGCSQFFRRFCGIRPPPFEARPPPTASLDFIYHSHFWFQLFWHIKMVLILESHMIQRKFCQGKKDSLL